MLSLPWVGGIARKFATSQMARTLATLLGGGIPLVQALDVPARSVSNRYIAARARDGRPVGARRAEPGGHDAERAACFRTSPSR